MTRNKTTTALSVPYAEKDEAKSLGAKWDAINKVWFVPAGVDAAPFKKWLPNKRPVPDIIMFRRNERGELTARIDNLEVGFFDHGGCFIIVWGAESVIPCDYSHSSCPDDMSRNWKNCSKSKNCPYESIVPCEDGWTVMTSREGTREQLEEKIRDMFIKKHDGIAHKTSCPEPAASEFAVARWEYGARQELSSSAFK
jgi:hypothetical protein